MFVAQCIEAFGLRGAWIYAQLKAGRTSGVSLPGVKFPITLRRRPSDKISFKEVFIRREYDIPFPAGFEPETIVDGGANIGLTSVFLANRFPKARVVAVEADRGNFECLSENARPYPSITAVHCAIWRAKERIVLVDKGLGDRAFVVEPGDGPGSIQATSIPDLMRDHGLERIDLLKLDIEGSEKEVFAHGADAWLARTRCLVIELHDRMKRGCSRAVFEAVGRHDFSASVHGENLVFFRNERG